jgi:hypothetical protein
MHMVLRHVNAEEYTVSAAGELQVIVEKCQRDRSTALIQVSHDADTHAQILLARGEVVGFYSQAGGGVAEAAGWSGLLDVDGGADVRVMILPPSVVRLARLLAECGEINEEKRLSQEGILPLIESWRGQPGANAIHFVWENAEAILVLPEGGWPVRDVVFISGGNVESGLDAYGQILAWAEGDCVAGRYSGDGHPLAWADYNLHYAFTMLAERFLERYEQFTGRILINAIARDIAITAEREGWDISIHATTIDDQALSRTLEQTAAVYREVLITIQHHMTVVLGGKLVSTIFTEALDEMESPYLELVDAHKLLPDGFVSLRRAPE